MSARTTTIDLNSPDPTQAINAFLWAMSNARNLGFTPRTEHTLIEHLMRQDVHVLYYHNSGGIFSMVEGKNDDPADFDMTLEVIELIGRRKRRNAMKRAEEAKHSSAEVAEPAPTE